MRVWFLGVLFFDCNIRCSLTITIAQTTLKYDFDKTRSNYYTRQNAFTKSFLLLFYKQHAKQIRVSCHISWKNLPKNCVLVGCSVHDFCCIQHTVFTLQATIMLLNRIRVIFTISISPTIQRSSYRRLKNTGLKPAES